MTRFAEGYPEGSQYQKIIFNLTQHARPCPKDEITRLETVYGQRLPYLEGYEPQKLLDDQQVEIVRTALMQETAKPARTLRKLYLPKNGDFIWSSESRVEWEAKGYDPRIIESLQPVDEEEVHWAIAGSSDAPEDADSYWECGDPIALVKQHDTNGWRNEDFKRVFGKQWMQKFTLSLDSNKFVDEVLCELVPVKYFRTTSPMYGDTVEAAARHTIDIVRSTESAKNTISVRIRKAIFRVAEQGGDGAQFVNLLERPDVQVKTLAELSCFKKDPDLAGRALACTLAIDDRKQRANAVMYLFGCQAVLTDEHLETLVMSARDPKELIKVYEFISANRREKARNCYEKTYEVITGNFAGAKRNDALERLCEQAIPVDPTYARTLVQELPPWVNKETIEKKIAACELKQAAQKILDSSKVAEGLYPENNSQASNDPVCFILAERNLSSFDLTGDDSFLLKALTVGILITDQRKREQIFNRIADGLTDESLPKGEEGPII